MAKTYLSSAKYRIIVQFEVSGIVDKHDVIGAVFGQSEGLLGSSMDLKELQQNGKIGRIEIEADVVNGKTTGKLFVPSSIDTVQTSMLAAAIESVDKVGPCDAKFETLNIEDTRAQKRGQVTDRAKELLQKFMNEQSPDLTEIREDITTGVRTAQIVEYGTDKLPAGPDIDKSEEIIVVEGRADVLNLLKHGITNVIAMDGTQVPATIVELSKTKKITAFVDGDRGGELNIRNLQGLARVDSIVQAPPGREVEELSKKEILLSLKRETATEPPRAARPAYAETRGPPRERRMGRGFGTRSDRQGSSGMDRRGPPGRDRRMGGQGRPMHSPSRGFGNRNPRMGRSNYGPPQSNRFDQGYEPRESSAPNTPFQSLETIHSSHVPTSAETEPFKPYMTELKGTMNAKILDENKNEVAQTSIKDLLPKLKKTKNAHTIVFDGIITKRLVETAAKQGVNTIVGIKQGKIDDAKGINLMVVKD